MKWSTLILVGLLAMGCQTQNEYDLGALEDQVMDSHDEVMPLMDPLYQTRRKLQQKLVSDSLSMTSAEILKFKETIVSIESAEDAMMDWMHNYDPNFEGETDSLTFAYLTEKKRDIDQVNLTMKAAKLEGESLLK